MTLRSIVLTTALLATVVATSAPAFAAGGDRLIRRCSANGDGDISMSARYEVRSDRKRFDVEFEARASSVYAAGKPIVFRVASTRVGRDVLAPVIGGDVVAELNLDSRGADDDGDQKPMPANFPAVTRGTSVSVLMGGRVVLACRLN